MDMPVSADMASICFMMSGLMPAMSPSARISSTLIPVSSENVDRVDLFKGHIVAAGQILGHSVANDIDLCLFQQVAQITDRDEGHLFTDNNKDITAFDTTCITGFLSLFDEAFRLFW